MRNVIFIFTILLYSCADNSVKNEETKIVAVNPIQSDHSVEQIDTTTKYRILESVAAIYFDHNSSTIKKKDLYSLNKIADICASDSFAYLKIFGFTDTIGTGTFNDSLAEKRAMKVHDILNRNNKIDKKLIYVTWLGESDETYDLHFDQAHYHENCVDVWVMTRKTIKNTSR
jgi:outer membrane protein OmpA-like peptidoglycan-associated protein